MAESKHIKSFRLFESTETNYISFDDLKDIFVDIIHKGYEIKFYDERNQKSGKYFFEFKKSPSEDSLGHFSSGSAYGYSNLSKIKEEIDVFDILEDCKYRLNSMGYTIGFEFEFNISTSTGLTIVCHLQHSSLDEDEPEVEDESGWYDELFDEGESEIEEDDDHL